MVRMMLLKKYVSLNEAISYLESECGFKTDRPLQEQVKDIVQIAKDNEMKLYVHYRGEVKLVKNYTRGNLTQFTDECCTVYLNAIYETLYGCPIGESISKIELGELEVTLWIYYKVHEWITLPRSKNSKYTFYDYSDIDHSKETIIKFNMNDENKPTFSDIRILSDDLINLVKNVEYKNSDLLTKNQYLEKELKKTHERIKILENQQLNQPSDMSAKLTTDTDEYQHNQRKPIKHLLYALIKAKNLTLTEKGQGNTHSYLFSLCSDFKVPVTEGFLKSRLKELYQLEQDLQKNSKNISQ